MGMCPCVPTSSSGSLSVRLPSSVSSDTRPSGPAPPPSSSNALRRQCSHSARWFTEKARQSTWGWENEDGGHVWVEAWVRGSRLVSLPSCHLLGTVAWQAGFWRATGHPERGHVPLRCARA